MARRNAGPAPNSVREGRVSMQRERRRWQTPLGRFVARRGVSWIVQELEAAGPRVTPFAVYHWVAGVSAPRPTFARTLVRISRGALSLNDIYGHREQLAEEGCAVTRVASQATRGGGPACRST